MADQVDPANPGWFSFHCAQVRTGIWLFRSEPAWVPGRPFSASLARSPASRRPIVAADIDTSLAATSSLMPSSPALRSTATISGRNGAIRLPAGASITAHTLRRDHLQAVHRLPRRARLRRLRLQGLPQ